MLQGRHIKHHLLNDHKNIMGIPQAAVYLYDPLTLHTHTAHYLSL